MAATDGTGAGRPDSNPTEGGERKDSPPTVNPNSTPTDMPERLGRYLIKQRLGGGGMGAVYLVENTALNREEALKVPHFESSSDPKVRERFLREAKAAGRLDHPNICPVYDTGVIDGVYYLTMRLLPGKLLATYNGRPHPPRAAVNLVLKLAQALDYAHGKGVIHRDLKPSNVMMCPGVGPTVMDFGLAKQILQEDKKLTQTGSAMGTPAYMPPEQVRGELDRIGAASDVYSLGVILFELLTGELPFRGSIAEVMGQVLYAETPLPSQLRPDLNRAVDAVCGKAMAKNPQERHASMKEFAAALQELLRVLPGKQESGAAAAQAADKNSGGGFDEPTVPPPALPVAKRPPPPSKTIPRTMADQAPKARQKVRKLEDVDARPPAPPRGTPVAVWLVCLALLLGGGVITLIALSGGKDGGTKKADAGAKKPSFNKDKAFPNDKGIGFGKKDKDDGIAKKGDRPDDKGPKGMAGAFDNDFAMRLLPIPGGTFTMGSPESEKDRSTDERQHDVDVSSFHLGIHEVTQKQFRAVMGYNPSYFSKNAKGKDGVDYGSRKPGGGSDKIPAGDDTEDYPVENVSWLEANEFCDKLTAKDTKKADGQVYRLPTEAEWEYACRGGAPSYQVFHFGKSLSSKEANFDGNYPYGGADKADYLRRTRAVGSYEKNRFGLHDMHGNVWEWCLDWYGADYYGKSPALAKDPRGPLGGSARVIRGGSWCNYGLGCRSADRFRFTPGDRYFYLGFRVALVPSERK